MCFHVSLLYEKDFKILKKIEIFDSMAMSAVNFNLLTTQSHLDN